LLEPGEPHEIDIAWRAHHDPPFPSDEMRIASAKEYGERSSIHWNRTQDFIPLRPGSYLLTVCFQAEGYDDPVTRTYRLDWPGPNQENSIRLVEPNKVPVPKPAPPETPSEVPVQPSEPAQFERLHIDPEHVPYAAIRDLLEAAFDAGTLRSFCQDRPAFEPLLRCFGPADGLASLVAKVLEYCRTELLWDELLTEVEGANPRQYARFQEHLGGPAAALPIPGRPPGRPEPLPQPSPINRPTVEGTDPADGAKNVSRWLRSIKVRFKRDMRSDSRGIGSGPKGWFGLDDPEVDYDPVTRTFTISRDNAEPLPPNTTIEFTINDPRHEGGFVDLDGNLAEYHSFRITTGSELEMDLSALRRWLKQRFDDPGLDTFCLDHFSEVYDSFGRGMRKD